MDYYSVPRRILRGARQLVYPRRCPFCDRVLGSVPICPDCAAELEELRRKPGMRLDASQHYLGELTGAAAPFRYEGCVRRGILHTKYHAAPWTAVELGLWLAKLAFGSEMHMAGAEPVPELVEGMSLGTTASFPYRHPAERAAIMCRSSWRCRWPAHWGYRCTRKHWDALVQSGIRRACPLSSALPMWRVPSG